MEITKESLTKEEQLFYKFTIQKKYINLLRWKIKSLKKQITYKEKALYENKKKYIEIITKKNNQIEVLENKLLNKKF